MVTIFAHTDKVMLKMMLSEEAVGIYSAAVTCAGLTSFVFAAIIDVCFMWIIAIPLAACVAYFTNVQPYIIYICLLSEQIFKAIVGFYRIKSGKWLHNVVE